MGEGGGIAYSDLFSTLEDLIENDEWEPGNGNPKERKSRALKRGKLGKNEMIVDTK